MRLFATARRAVGQEVVSLTVPAGGLRARELVARLAGAYPRLGPTLRGSRFLRNDRYLRDLDEQVVPGDEFAVHPPYGGG